MKGGKIGIVSSIIFLRKKNKERRALLLHSFFALLSRSFLSKTQSGVVVTAA
jgi:hypothetical protein|tara:strand:+ start:455 stop:610 length:156 start_codon:yes stop_codon:yes gene_type:complete